MAKQRTCLVCGTKYEYCPHCGKHNPKETWRFLFCSENCNKVDNVIASFRSKEISADEAKNKLSALGVSKTSTVTNYIRSFLEQIFDNSTQTVTEKAVNVESEESEIKVEETVATYSLEEEIAQTSLPTKKSKFSKKKIVNEN